MITLIYYLKNFHGNCFIKYYFTDHIIRYLLQLTCDLLCVCKSLCLRKVCLQTLHWFLSVCLIRWLRRLTFDVVLKSHIGHCTL